jgi:hypothetical protein
MISWWNHLFCERRNFRQCTNSLETSKLLAILRFSIFFRTFPSTHREWNAFHTSHGETSISGIAGATQYLMTVHFVNDLLVIKR